MRIGGIDVNVPAPIADYQFPDMNYGYDPLILSAGMQHMDGYTAQKYARTRHGDSDFDRARSQQQVLFAMRDRILSGDALPQLIVQAPSLYGSISQNVYTDLSLEQMIQLALWLKDLPADNIHTGVIDPGLCLGLRDRRRRGSADAHTRRRCHRCWRKFLAAITGNRRRREPMIIILSEGFTEGRGVPRPYN